MYRNTTSPGALRWTRPSLNSRRVLATLGVVMAVLLASIATGTSSVSAAAGYNFSVLDTVSVGPSPSSVAVSPDGSRLYAASSNHYLGKTSNTVSVVNTSSSTVTATVTVGDLPYRLALSPDGSRLYVTNALDDSVSVIYTSSNAVTATISVGDFPTSMVTNFDGSRLYVTNTGDDSISVINTSSNTVTATISVGNTPTSLALSADGSRLYVAVSGGNGEVSVINTSSNAVTATISVGSYPYGLALSADGSRLYVTNHMGYSVSVINTSSNTVTATVSVGTNPYGLAMSADGSRLYVANQGSNSVSVINTSSNTVTATVSVGSYPSNMATNIDGSRLYVANTDDDTLSVIDTSAWPTAPAAPTSLNATPGNGSASIAFTAGSNGGAAITKYQYRLGNGSWVDAGSTSPITINGLTNYTTYSIKIRAVNSAGAGTPSTAVSVRPKVAGPTIGVAYSSGKHGVQVGFNFARPAGATLTGFTVRAYAKGTGTVVSSCQVLPNGRGCYIGSLVSGTEYDIAVQAYFTSSGDPKVRETLESARSRVRVNN